MLRVGLSGFCAFLLPASEPFPLLHRHSPESMFPLSHLQVSLRQIFLQTKLCTEAQTRHFITLPKSTQDAASDTCPLRLTPGPSAPWDGATPTLLPTVLPGTVEVKQCMREPLNERMGMLLCEIHSHKGRRGNTG